MQRTNGTTKYEFYPFYEGALTSGAINQVLGKYPAYYNPHDVLDLATPVEYYMNLM